MTTSKQARRTSHAERWVVSSTRGRLLLIAGGALAAIVVRGGFDSLVGDRVPYVLFAIAAAIVSWLAGGWSGALLLVVGWATGNVLWVPPRGTLAFGVTHADLLQTIFYFVIGGLMVAFMHRARGVQWRATQAASERETERLARAESELRFRKLAEAVDDAFYVADLRARRVLYLSPAFERIWGIDADGVLRDANVLQQRIHPDDRALTADALERVIRDGSHTVTYRIVRPDGSVRWVRHRASMMDDGNLAGVASDVTDEMTEELARRAREERLRISETSLQAALDLVDMASWTIDVRTGTAHLSDRLFRILGLEPQTARPTIETWIARVHPEDRAWVDEIWRRSVETGGTFNETYRVVWPDGTVRWVEARGGFLRDEHGVPTIGTGAFLDITERRRDAEARERLLENAERLRSEAEAARREAEAANVAKDTFLATLSHELRSPLQGMMGWLAVLRSGRADAARTQRALDAIERSVRLQSQLVSDLLDVSRIVAGKLQLAVGTVDVCAIVEATIEEMRPLARQNGVTLTADAPAPALVSGDPERLHQIVANLVSNAIKFTRQGGSVAVHCERTGDEVTIVVEDTGEGIDAATLPRIFDRFAQADPTPNRRHGGLGLGLAIVKHLTEAHGGRVEAHSEGIGRGSTFTVVLPAARASATASALLPGSPRSRGESLGGVDVLLVEDDDASRESLALLLEERGANVVQASSAATALSAFRAHPPRVIISDIGLGSVDGYRLLETIRETERGRAVPAIALTGFASAQDRQRALEAGFHAHVAKPAHPDDLVATVVRALAETTPA